jgi:hypothetical protein
MITSGRASSKTYRGTLDASQKKGGIMSSSRAFPRVLSLAAASVLITASAAGQSMFDEEFTGFNTGTSLVGQGGWSGDFGTPDDPLMQPADTSPLVFTDYTGGGGVYTQFVTAGGFSDGRVYRAYDAGGVINSDAVFYLAFLVRVTAVVDPQGQPLIGLGNAFGGTRYEFLRIEAKPSGAGYVLGVSKGAGLPSQAPSAAWGSTELSFGSTHLVIARYDFSAAVCTLDPGGADDQLWLWIDPSLSSEPSTGDAAASFGAGAGGGDVLCAGDTLDNLNLIFRSDGPTAAVDGIKVARATTSSAAWTSLDSFVPVELLSFHVE